MNLYPHQVKVLNESEGLNRVAYYLDMGLGKTFVGAEKLISLGESVNLLICQKSKINDWLEHFGKYYNEFPYLTSVFDLTNKNSYQKFLNTLNDFESYEMIDDKTGISYLQESLDPRMCIGVINYELAWRRPELLKVFNGTLMLDESSMIQNRTAKQSKWILKLKPKNVILLSGSPVSGKYENLWTQCVLLGYEITHKEFENQYVLKKPLMGWDGKAMLSPKGFPIQTVIGYKNEERLKRKLREHGAQFLKTEDVLDLPEQTFTDIRVPSTATYKRFMKDRIVKLGDIELVGDMPLKKLLYARQLASQYNPNKLQALSDLLASTQERLIIFYSFNDELAKLKEICKDRPISEVNGHVKDLEAYENETNTVTLCQYQAASKGLNLQKANKLIFFSPTLRVEDYMQSQKRIHRIGQDQPCFYYRLITENSVEEKVYASLERGVDYTDALFEEDTP